MNRNISIFNPPKTEFELAATLERATRGRLPVLIIPRCTLEPILILMGGYIALISAIITLTVCGSISLTAALIIIVVGISFLESALQFWRDKNGH